ncbi:MAG: sodium:solute symporter [Bryobacteraceae bacterium]
MRLLDWIVLFGWIVALVSYGLYRGRGSDSVDKFLLAGKTMPWYAMGLSIMATQASAITFISTTGQAFTDGMRFVQFYFGLPLAMVILSATVVPAFHRTRVYTAYEFLEQRFDAKTRALVSGIFLIQRGLGAGIALYAPAVVLSVVLGWPDRYTTMLMGGLVVLYTTMGGIKAVTHADVQQMMVIFAALILSFGMAVYLMPADVSFGDAVRLAGAAGKLNVVDTKLDLDNRYNLWSGLIGGMFLMLAYFGTDQSQVQRYLTGKSIGQSRLSLLFNAMAKIPMQFFILFIGTMVFVFFLFEKPPVLFQPVEQARIEQQPGYAAVTQEFDKAHAARAAAARKIVAADRAGDAAAHDSALAEFRSAQKDFDTARKDGAKLASPAFSNDTNYIFLSFVTHYLPPGVVGLIIGVIFTAAMSAISGEINSLATVTVIDIYRRYIAKNSADAHYLLASRLATVFWGVYAVVFASFGGGFGALIEVVNLVGSLFYGSMLGVFILAFFFKRIGSNAAFWGTVIGQITILAAAKFTNVAFLWYNLIGPVAVIVTALLITAVTKKEESALA